MCRFPIYDLELPCGHVAESVLWEVPSDLVLFDLTHFTAICWRIWRRSRVMSWCRSVYPAVNTAASWLVAQTPPPSNAGKFAETSTRAADEGVNLGAMNVRRLRGIVRHLVEALFLLSARTTKVILAIECSSANISAAFRVPQITRAIRNVPKHVGSAVSTRNAKSNAGNLAHRVWSHANGTVPTKYVQLFAVR